MIAGMALGGCVCGHLRSKDQLSLDTVEPSDVMLALDRIGVWPHGSATASGLVLPVLVGPQEPVKVFGNLISERPAAEADTELAVSVHWSLGPLSGTVDESAILRALGVPGM